MTPRPHSDTETRLEGFEARIQDAFVDEADTYAIGEEKPR